MLKNRSLCLMWEVGEGQQIPKQIFMANLKDFLHLQSFACGFLLQIHHRRKTLMKTLRPTAAVWGRNVSWLSQHLPPLLYLGLPLRYFDFSDHVSGSRKFLGEIQVLCGKSGILPIWPSSCWSFFFFVFYHWSEHSLMRGYLLPFSKVKNSIPLYKWFVGFHRFSHQSYLSLVEGKTFC